MIQVYTHTLHIYIYVGGGRDFARETILIFLVWGDLVPLITTADKILRVLCSERLASGRRQSTDRPERKVRSQDELKRPPRATNAKNLGKKVATACCSAVQL